MRHVTLLDTATSSDNLGDEIIMEAIREQVQALMRDTYLATVATHVGLRRTSRRILRATELAIAGGTNFISSDLLRHSGWKISAFDLPWMHDVVMMGVGWRDYQRKPTRYSAFVYKRALSRKRLHACRDQYSTERLRSLGFEVVNTSCPTMWSLTPERCRLIPTRKAPAVVTALTFYRPDRTHDQALLDLLRARYARVYFWTQQAPDRAYLRSLEAAGLHMISPTIAAFDDLLRREDVDFVGSRLHGGIRALQHGRRTLILSVDNRATEIGRDTGLPVTSRSDLAAVAAWIDAGRPTEIQLPTEAIQAFKAQFAGF